MFMLPWTSGSWPLVVPRSESSSEGTTTIVKLCGPSKPSQIVCWVPDLILMVLGQLVAGGLCTAETGLGSGRVCGKLILLRFRRAQLCDLETP